MTFLTVLDATLGMSYIISISPKRFNVDNTLAFKTKVEANSVDKKYEGSAIVKSMYDPKPPVSNPGIGSSDIFLKAQNRPMKIGIYTIKTTLA